MTPCTRHITLIALIISMALPAWGEQYLLYVPQPLPRGQKASSQDGILVQNILVKRGDTLYDLSRKFSGHGMYYPQILLFNSIKNPALIYPGNTLKIPFNEKSVKISERGETPKTSRAGKNMDKTKAELPSRKSAAVVPVLPPSTELSLSDLKTVGTARKNAGRHNKKSEAHAKKSPTTLPSLPATDTQRRADPSEALGVAGQQLFEAAVKAYRKDDCLAAIELLDRYLAGNSSSPLAADASLYRAECYLKLSAQ